MKIIVKNKINYEKNETNTAFIKNNKLILETQQRLKSESHNVFTREINKIALSWNDKERTQSINSIGTYAYRKDKDLVSETKQNDIKMINFNDVAKENIRKHNPNWPQIPDHPYNYTLFNLISHQPDIDKTFFMLKIQLKQI